MLVLGLDPGKTTGAAVLRLGAAAPWPVERVAAIRDELLAPWLRQLVQEVHLDGAVLETYEYQGRARASGIGPQAFAAGRCAGLLEALGVARVVCLRRREVLAGLGVQTEDLCHRTVARLVSVRVGYEGTPHEWDAIAVAIIGAGRLQGPPEIPGKLGRHRRQAPALAVPAEEDALEDP